MSTSCAPSLGQHCVLSPKIGASLMRSPSIQNAGHKPVEEPLPLVPGDPLILAWIWYPVVPLGLKWSRPFVLMRPDRHWPLAESQYVWISSAWLSDPLMPVAAESVRMQKL